MEKSQYTPTVSPTEASDLSRCKHPSKLAGVSPGPAIAYIVKRWRRVAVSYFGEVIAAINEELKNHG